MLPKTINRVVVCVTALALICGVALASPVRRVRETPRDPEPRACSKHAKELLMGLKRALNRTQGSATLFHGFNCTELEAQVHTGSNTVNACQPGQDLTCAGQVRSTFNKDECLSSIISDLDYHHSTITAYVESLNSNTAQESITKLRSISDSIQALKQKCDLLPKRDSGPPKGTVITDSFQARVNMCKELKGFHIRAITINRALGFISAQETKN